VSGYVKTNARGASATAQDEHTRGHVDGRMDILSREGGRRAGGRRERDGAVYYEQSEIITGILSVWTLGVPASLRGRQRPPPLYIGSSPGSKAGWRIDG